MLRKREARAYLLSQIGNADQTPVYFDMPVAYTVSEKGAKEVKVHSRYCEAVLHSGQAQTLYFYSV